MSRETDQTLVLLATFCGCMETHRMRNSFARVDIRRAITAGYDAAFHAIKTWPGWDNREWVKSRRERFARYLESLVDRGYNTVAICCMCERIIADLIHIHGHNRERMEKLQPVADASRIVHDFADRAGDNYPAYEMSDELLDELYKIVELKEFLPSGDTM